MLETFIPPRALSPGTHAKPKLKLKKAEFGDGYTQTTRDGLNHIRKTLNLTWEKLLPAQAREIVEFMERKGGDTAFYYTPSDEWLPIKWTCEERGFRKVTATLTQYFGFEG